MDCKRYVEQENERAVPYTDLAPWLQYRYVAWWDQRARSLVGPQTEHPRVSQGLLRTSVYLFYLFEPRNFLYSIFTWRFLSHILILAAEILR